MYHAGITALAQVVQGCVEFVEQVALDAAKIANGFGVVAKLLRLAWRDVARFANGLTHATDGVLKTPGGALSGFALRKHIRGKRNKIVDTRTTHHWVAGTSVSTLPIGDGQCNR